MLPILLTISAAYFFVQGVIGCMFLFGLLQLKREHGKLNGLVTSILTGLLYCLTMGGVFVVAILYRKYDVDMNDGMRFAFVITGFAMLGLLFVVIKEWNRLLQKLK
ncbi:hypothetical protein [Nitrosovibrio sp. Nv17]|jgi:hypothetical protein|uniref:hypothetical protein n=1 Tax=Nitrosovibrio sp. Nv17 TaxID=1855339 RepID=UPI001160667B|nr:hypothetical protein [Nitrosovibrio sp. Nv17]